MNHAELRDLILNSQPATKEYARALQKLRQTNHMSAAFGKNVFENETWTRYKNGIEFVHEFTQELETTKKMPWSKVLVAFFKYRDMEDVIRRILEVIDNDYHNSLTENYYTDLFPEASVDNIQLVGALVGIYPDNSLVQGMGPLILSKMYSFKTVALSPQDNDMYKKHLTLAQTALSRPDRQHGVVFSMLNLIVAIMDSDHGLQIGVDLANEIDLMSTIFDVQYQISKNENLLKLCDRVSTRLLPHWTDPVQMETRAHPGALHIIMASVHAKPASLFNKEVACRQLHLWIASNPHTLRITHDVVLFVANMIREAQFRPSQNRFDMRAHDLWKFVQVMMDSTHTTPHTYADRLGLLERSFSMQFLLLSLSTHTSIRNEFRNPYEMTIGKTVRHICELALTLMIKTEGTVVRDLFLKLDGISVLFTVIHNQCNEGRMDEPGPALENCMDILIYIFGTNDGTAELYLTMSTRQHARVLRKFAYGLPDSTIYCDNISTFIRKTLIDATPGDKEECTISRLMDLEKMLWVLLLLSTKDKIFFADDTYAMVEMLKMMTYTFNMYTRELPRLHAQGEVVTDYTVCLRDMVMSLDKMNSNIERSNGYSFVRYHEERWDMKYVETTQAYRAPFDDDQNAMHI
jgi:hypothetical protein